jgi:hypothetical protein
LSGAPGAKRSVGVSIGLGKGPKPVKRNDLWRRGPTKCSIYHIRRNRRRGSGDPFVDRADQPTRPFGVTPANERDER